MRILFNWNFLKSAALVLSKTVVDILVGVITAKSATEHTTFIRGHRKYRREGGTKNRDRVGGKNMASGRGTNLWDREGVGRGNF